VTTGDVDGETVSEDPYLADWTNIATPGSLGILSPGPGGADDAQLRRQLQQYLASLPQGPPLAVPSMAGTLADLGSVVAAGLPLAPPVASPPPADTIIVAPSPGEPAAPIAAQAAAGAAAPAVGGGGAAAPAAPDAAAMPSSAPAAEAATAQAGAGGGSAAQGAPVDGAVAGGAAPPQGGATPGVFVTQSWQSLWVDYIDQWATPGLVRISELFLLVLSGWMPWPGLRIAAVVAVMISWWRVTASWATASRSIVGGLLMATTTAGAHCWNYLGSVTLGVFLASTTSGGILNWLPFVALWRALGPRKPPTPAAASGIATGPRGILRAAGGARAETAAQAGGAVPIVTFRDQGQGAAALPPMTPTNG